MRRTVFEKVGSSAPCHFAMPLNLHSMRQLLRPISMINGRTLKCRLPLHPDSQIQGEWTVVAGGQHHLWQRSTDVKSQRYCNPDECHTALQDILSIPIVTLSTSIDYWQNKNGELARMSQQPNFHLWALCEGFSPKGFQILDLILKRDQQYLNTAKQLLAWRSIKN